MNEADLKEALRKAEILEKYARDEIIKLYEVLAWVMRYWDHPEFRGLYKIKENDTIEFVPASVEKMILEVARGDFAGAVSVLGNIEEIKEEIKRDC